SAMAPMIPPTPDADLTGLRCDPEPGSVPAAASQHPIDPRMSHLVEWLGRDPNRLCPAHDRRPGHSRINRRQELGGRQITAARRHRWPDQRRSAVEPALEVALECWVGRMLDPGRETGEVGRERRGGNAIALRMLHRVCVHEQPMPGREPYVTDLPRTLHL